VDYLVGWNLYKSEWICLEHSGYARGKAVAWWKRRSSDPVPTTIERAVQIALGGGLAITNAITVRSVSGEQYERIIDCQLGPMPEPLPESHCEALDLDEAPF
jgi:DNA repair protein RadD